MLKNLRIRRIRIRNTAVNRNIHIRDKLASEKINAKNLGRWLGLEILSHQVLIVSSFTSKEGRYVHTDQLSYCTAHQCCGSGILTPKMGSKL